jgi:NADP-dependent 3-hydroxy acid dehydrogenase YdfG
MTGLSFPLITAMFSPQTTRMRAPSVANVVMFMLTRPRGMTIRDVVMLPTNFDL